MKSLNAAILLLFSVQLYAQKNGGVGHSTIPQIASSDHIKNVSFTQHDQHDFDRDNHPDKLVCNHITVDGVRRINVNIKSGKTNKDIFTWRWNADNTNPKNGNKLLLTGCDVVYLRSNRPSVILSTAYSHPTAGVRVVAPQFIMFNRPSDNKLRANHIKVPGTDSFFRSAARSVKCAQVPAAIRNAGAKDGAYCFYAGYDANLDFGRGYGTATALVKFEQGQGDTFVVKDLTQSTGLPWSGGMKGTNMGAIRTVRLCSGSGKYDGLHMMGGAFLDFNRDGLTDLVTVGQHASVRSHKMVLSHSRDEKFYFANEYISDVNKGGMSEFLRILSLDENEMYASSSCVYISGEKYNGCGSVPDHLRCFRSGQWETSYPKGEQFSSTMAPVTVKANGKGSLVIKSTNIVNDKNVGSKHFYLSGAYDDKIVLSVGNPAQDSKNVTVSGWACVPNTGWRPRITISNKSHHTEKGYKKYFQRVVDLNAEPMLMRGCMQPKTYPLRFKAVIPKANLTSQTGKMFIQADFYHDSKINLKHVQKQVQY